MSRIKYGGAPNVYAVLKNVHTGETRTIEGANIITDQGDLFYARRGCGSTDAWTIGGLRLGTRDSTPAKGSVDVGAAVSGGSKAIDSGYPKWSDNDSDNAAYSSVDSVTWRVSFGTSEANATGIYEGAIVQQLTPYPSGTALCVFKFAAAFDKTSSDTLKVFVNHLFNGS